MSEVAETPGLQPIETREDFLNCLSTIDRSNVETIIDGFRQVLTGQKTTAEIHAVGGMVTQEGTQNDIDVAVNLQLGNRVSTEGSILTQAERRYVVYREIINSFPREILERFELEEKPPYINQEYQSDSILASDGTFVLKPKDKTAKPIEVVCSLEDNFSKGMRKSVLLDTIKIEEENNV